MSEPVSGTSIAAVGLMRASMFGVAIGRLSRNLLRRPSVDCHFRGTDFTRSIHITDFATSQR